VQQQNKYKFNGHFCQAKETSVQIRQRQGTKACNKDETVIL